MENNHFVRIKVKVGSGKNHQWTPHLGGKERQRFDEEQGYLPTAGLLVSRETNNNYTKEKSANTLPGDQN